MKTGIYIHIPYCRKKCGYCGFVSYPLSCSSVPDDFIDALLLEMQLYRDRFGRIEADTVFVGGGTPSLLSAAQIGRLFAGLSEHFEISCNAEVTMEANPDSLTGDVISAMRRAGVNRLSLGAQAMNDELLQVLGRIHDTNQIIRALRLAKEAGFKNINLDLMFGLPTQTNEQWTHTLSEALALAPSHLSLYTLQLEEGTHFYRAYKAGRMDLPDTKTDRSMYHSAVSFLKSNGWQHYEISNFSLPGMACRHNLKYWDMSPFIGLGPAAASYFQGKRYQNQADTTAWMKMVTGGNVMSDEAGPESFDDAMEVFCFTALRTAKGLAKERFEKLFGMSINEAYRHDPLPVGQWKRDGLIRETDEAIILTEKGIDVSNEIMSAFMR